ncbi:MAG TPA: CHAD domain-containing protein [Patescibacteria group bacterium]|nr:CHAD domain-containing protein [Patescibacteria group bacterium]
MGLSPETAEADAASSVGTASPPDSPAPSPAGAPADAPLLPSLGRQPGTILRGDSFATAGRKAMWVQVDRMLAREEAVRDPSQTDALKRYRVATRRLRAALRVFRDAYPKRGMKPIRAGLSDLAGALGAVRDLDVRLEEVDRWKKQHDATTGAAIEPLRAHLAARRQAAAATLARKLDSRGHRRLRVALIEFVTAIEPDAGAPGSAPDRNVRDRAGSSVWTAYELVHAYASVVRSADLTTLHQLRIEAKRLRYTIEFLGDVLGPDREWVIEKLVALQDHLGAVNDATLAVAAIRGFLGERHPTLSPEERAAVVAYLGERERELTGLRGSVGRAWRPVGSVTFARRLGRALVDQPQRAPSTPAAS